MLKIPGSRRSTQLALNGQCESPSFQSFRTNLGQTLSMDVTPISLTIVPYPNQFVICNIKIVYTCACISSQIKVATETRGD